MMYNLLSLTFILQIIAAAPLPRVITRMHTANPVTVTNTYTTGTTTVNLPPVEIFISNGVTYTFTLTDQAVGSPTTTTSIYNKDVEATQTTESCNTKVVENNAGTTNNNNDATEGASGTSTSSVTSAVPNVSGTANSVTISPSNFKSSSQTYVQTTAAQSSATTNDDSSNTSTAQTTSGTSSTGSEETTASTSGISLPTSANRITSDYASLTAPDTIVYSPYNDDGTCKVASSINSDLEYIYSKNIKKIRLYGVDCNVLTAVLPQCSKLGIKVNQGLWISSDGIDSIDDSLSDLVDYIKSEGSDVFSFITVGNEAVNAGYVSVTDLISKISSVKSTLNKAGYNGDITTSEPPITFINSPSLCTSSDIDFVGINPHSYFDTELTADEAGTYVVQQQKEVKSSCGSKNVVITETGYPNKGDTNGKNVPSADNQKKAIESILQETNGDITILSTYNDYWKEPGQYGIEQYFGAITLFD
ncbi:uncharacterized protein PRCAT00003567001 [Priceomyces carsonii]|uniref:uncharacterized protein n=1 Tax=Priceomyces carsonii TaxID=28549 RepID=UPI002ED8284D|nr:unnamed protein product [Priceomyces carsonii]